MIGTDIKLLFRKLNSQATTGLYDAMGLAVERSHYEVAFEHFLLMAIDVPETDLALILDYFKVDRPKLRNSLNKALESFNSGNTGKPVFSPVLQELLETSWLAASVDLGLNSLRTGAILLGYLRRPSLFSQGGPLPELGQISRDELEKNFFKILLMSPETVVEPGDREGADQAAAAGSGESFVDKYCEDFSRKAAQGKIHPVFGRDNEIRSIINILARRHKNNPILVGEPGVGKTAVIEGLANRIHEGDVPDTLKGVTLLSLDMGLLEAGVRVKGEFERRLKGVMDEIKASPKPIILFIDDAHTLVGAGGPAGGSDAANLLKPTLARGEIKTCAATTWKEYKKYFEKDAALARRFQLVALDEPDVPTCVLILRGLRDYYEKVHGVYIRDEAIVAAAELSNRYISGRFLPDKAVDLIDTACARVKVGLVAKPKILEETERVKDALIREGMGLSNDTALDDSPELEARIDALDKSITELSDMIVELTDSWENQRAAAQSLCQAKLAYFDAVDKPNPSDPETLVPYALVNERAKALDEAKAAFAQTVGPEVQIDVEVTAEVVAAVVSERTGITIARLATLQAQTVADLEKLLAERVKGQPEALAAITRVIKASTAGLRDPRQPIGVFLLVGPSGVGKTETGLALADLMFGDEKSVVTINMSEFQERHSASRLVGSPPGYVGYGEGGLLTEAVRHNPYRAVILNEVEKAHQDVLNLFYQVFDQGVLTDSEGKKVSFANALLLLTSNLASEAIDRAIEQYPDQSLEELSAAIRPILSKHFQPALLARMAIVPYRPLNRQALAQIADLKLKALGRRLKQNHDIDFAYSPEVVEAITDRCLATETGVRNIDYVLSSSVLPAIAQELLGPMATGDPLPNAIRLTLADDKSFKLSFSDPADDKSFGLSFSGLADDKSFGLSFSDPADDKSFRLSFSDPADYKSFGLIFSDPTDETDGAAVGADSANGPDPEPKPPDEDPWLTAEDLCPTDDDDDV
jgi:type VI secretion system protein VasG